MEFMLLAKPLWVNLLITAPIISYFIWRKQKLKISNYVLLTAGIFAIAFGFVEAAVVIYLRAAIGLPIDTGLAESAILIQNLSQFIFIEVIRESATIIMLISTAVLSIKSTKERFAIFLWVFAIWDIFYYAALWLLVGWPPSLFSQDLLFLIPAPWYSQVWFPILISILMILSVILNIKKKSKKTK